MVLSGGMGAALGALSGAWLGIPNWLSSAAGAALAVSFWLFGPTRKTETATSGPETIPDQALADGALAFLDALSEPAIVIEGNSRVSVVNSFAKERFGGAEIGVRFDAITRRPELIEAVRAALEDGRVSDVQVATQGAIERHERAHVAPINLQGRTRALLTLRDETETVLAEGRRADFIANASHELRTPLASLTGFIETLRGHARNDPDARDRFLEIMQAQAERMRRLIDGLLSLSRVELNEHLAPTSHVDLAAITRDVSAALGPLGDQKNVGLDFFGGESPVLVIGEWDELSQIVQNLIDNAIKYALPGSRISVSIGSNYNHEDVVSAASRQWPDAARLSLVSPPLETGRRFAYLRVSNAGEGIERWHLPRLAERFYRVEGQPTTRSGTGLGLAIVKHIINRHRGGLLVESAINKETAFAIYVPQPDELVSSN